MVSECVASSPVRTRTDDLRVGQAQPVQRQPASAPHLCFAQLAHNRGAEARPVAFDNKVVRAGLHHRHLHRVDTTGLAGANRQRAIRIIMAETGSDEETSAAAFERAEGDPRAALVMIKTGSSLEEARAALEASGGVIEQAVRIFRSR